MVGHAIKEELQPPQFSLMMTDKDSLNVDDHSEVMKFAVNNYDFIIHLAAMTDLEECEKDSKSAYLTNTIGTANMVWLARYLNIPIVYISTAGIFDGEKIGPYFTDDEPNPINHYGRSKWYGENFVTNYSKHYVLRAGWMMGGGPEVDKKFINKIFKKIKKGEKKIYVCDDIIGSPTYTIDLARSIKHIMLLSREIRYGIYNCSCQGKASRFEVAKKMVEYLNVDVEIIPVSSVGVMLEFPCKRSKNESLYTPKFTMRPWEAALKEYINDYFK